MRILNDMPETSQAPGDGVLADVDTKPGLNEASVPQDTGFFPKPGGGSISHWLAGGQKDPLFNYRSSPELPTSADILIIGSGVSALLIIPIF